MTRKPAPHLSGLAELVRQARQGRLHPSQLDGPRAAARRLRRPAGHRHLQHLVGADAVQRALPRASPSTSSAASGKPAALPFEFPVISLGETEHAARPRCCSATSSAWTSRNRSAANPIDGVVLLVGCDKTTPALVMGAASCDVPAHRRLRRPDAERQLPRRRRSASGTDVWQFSEEVKAGQMTDAASSWTPKPCMSRSAGTCMVMGTAVDDGHRWSRRSGSALPHNAAIPAVDSRRYALAHVAGRRIVEMVARRRAAVADPDARGVRERDPRQRRRRRIDQRRDPSARDRRARRRAAVARRLGPARPRRADARRPDAVGPLPDGGLLLRRRPAGGDARARRARAAAQGRADGERQDARGRTAATRRTTTPKSIRPLDKPLVAARRHRGAARQPRARRRGAQAVGGVAAPDEASRPRGRVREHRALQDAHRRSGARRRRRLACWC